MKALFISFALLCSASTLAQTPLTEALVSAKTDSERLTANRELREDIRGLLNSFESRDDLNALLESCHSGRLQLQLLVTGQQ